MLLDSIIALLIKTFYSLAHSFTIDDAVIVCLSLETLVELGRIGFNKEYMKTVGQSKNVMLSPLHDTHAHTHSHIIDLQ